MKRSSSQLKALARTSLSGQWGLPIGASLLAPLGSLIPSMIITGLLDPYSTVSIITCQILVYVVSILISLLQTGYIRLLLHMNRRETCSLKDLIYPYTAHPDRFLVVSLILVMAGAVLSLPFTILSYQETDLAAGATLSLIALLVQSLTSIILALFFGLANYLLLDYEDMGAAQALKESCRLMKGNKGRYLYITFSFIPLALVSIFTCYIGLLWLTPYMSVTMAYFYMDVTGELDNPKPPRQPEPEAPRVEDYY